MTQSNDNFTNAVQEAREQIEQKKYLEAIDRLDIILQNNGDNGDALLLRGKAYNQLKQYKLALTDYEKALDIYCELDNKKIQLRILMEIPFLYTFNGKIKEGFLAQQQSIRIAKQLNLPEDDPLYSYVSHLSQMSDEGLDKMQSTLQNTNSIPSWDKFGFMGKLMGYAMKGKRQSYLFVLVWLIMFLPGLILTIILSPIWLPVIVYQMWQQRNKNT